jgi:hypothetical protein
MHALQPLHVVVGGVADADIEAHLTLRHLVQRPDVQDASLRTLPRPAPSVLTDHGQKVSAHPQNVPGRKESFKEQITVLLRTGAKRRPVTE